MSELKHETILNYIRHYFDFWSLLVILITLLLFIVSLYFTGLTHDLLLEAAIFLVSVKLIIMSYKNKKGTDNLSNELRKIRSLLEKIDRK